MKTKYLILFLVCAFVFVGCSNGTSSNLENNNQEENNQEKDNQGSDNQEDNNQDDPLNNWVSVLELTDVTVLQFSPFSTPQYFPYSGIDVPFTEYKYLISDGTISSTDGSLWSGTEFRIKNDKLILKLPAPHSEKMVSLKNVLGYTTEINCFVLSGFYTWYNTLEYNLRLANENKDTFYLMYSDNEGTISNSTTTITVKKGWNAVSLDPYPLELIELKNLQGIVSIAY